MVILAAAGIALPPEPAMTPEGRKYKAGLFV